MNEHSLTVNMQIVCYSDRSVVLHDTNYNKIILPKSQHEVAIYVILSDDVMVVNQDLQCFVMLYF